MASAARPRVGLDAFAAFRRFNIPIAMHLEVFMRMAPWNRKIAAATGSWSSPFDGRPVGRGRSTSAYETAAGLPSDILDQAHVFGAASTDRIVARGNATRYVITKSHGAARFEALSFDGCAAALCSACVAALRVAQRCGTCSCATVVRRTPRRAGLDGAAARDWGGGGGS